MLADKSTYQLIIRTLLILIHLVEVCSEEQTKTRTLPCVLFDVTSPPPVSQSCGGVAQLLPVQAPSKPSESQLVYFAGKYS